MFPCSFRAGEMLAIAGKEYQIEYVMGERIHLLGVELGDRATYEHSDLLQHYTKGEITFFYPIRKPGEKAVLPTVKDRVLADFPEKIRDKALRKFKYLKAICPNGPVLVPREALAVTLKDLASEIEKSQKDKPPSVETFYRWRRRWLNAKFDVRALIDKFELRGLKPVTDFPEPLARIINEGIDTVYLTEERNSKRELYEWIENRIKLENRTLAPYDQLPRVSIRLINRFLSQHDRYQVLKARFGERIAKHSTRIFNRGPQCERPLERVEVDHTPLDILVVHDKTNLVLGRPWITVMIDKYTRMVVGLYISFRRPSSESVLRCLRNSILPKTYIKEQFPEISGEWPCYGLFETLYCDNGMEFHAKDLEAACASLGIHVVYCPPRSPHLKGAVERFLKTLNYNFLQMLPGTTFAKYEKRLDYDTVGNAVLTYKQLEEVLHRWLIDVYSIDFHRGIHDAPYESWKKAVQIHPPRLPPSPEHLKVHLGKVAERKLDRNGIRLHGLTYTSNVLEAWWNKSRSKQVLVRFDPDDIEIIYVLDTVTNTYIEATCTIPGYATGLTIEQHLAIQEKARNNYRSLPYRDQLLAAKVALRDYARSILEGALPKTKGARQARKEQKDVLQEDAMVGTRPSPMDPHAKTRSDDGTGSDYEFDDTNLPDFEVADRHVVLELKQYSSEGEKASFDLHRPIRSVSDLPKDLLDLTPPPKRDKRQGRN